MQTELKTNLKTGTFPQPFLIDQLNQPGVGKLPKSFLVTKLSQETYLDIDHLVDDAKKEKSDRRKEREEQIAKLAAM